MKKLKVIRFNLLGFLIIFCDIWVDAWLSHTIPTGNWAAEPISLSASVIAMLGFALFIFGQFID